MYQPEQPVFDQAIESNIEITYGIEDVPKPWWKSLYFALQITLVDFTPFVWGGSLSPWPVWMLPPFCPP